MGVTIQRRGKWWWLDISQDGKRFRRPTHTQEKRKAELIRHELESAILAGEWNVALALDTTLARGIERFQAEYEPIHHAPSTRKYSRKCFERVLGFIRMRRSGDVPMDVIGKSDIEAYQMDRSKDVTIRKGLVSASTVNRDVRKLSTLFKWAKSVGICRRNACQGVRALRGVKRKVQPMTDDEIRKLLEAAYPLLADLISRPGEPSSVRLLRARVVQNPKPACFAPLEVLLGPVRGVRIRGDFDPALLRKVVQALEAAS